MADGETQISTEVPDLAFGKDELVSRLDDLLEQYLYTLDAYEKAQQLLTKYLSSGYLDLAKANFTNNTRARYGQDYYDERMQASRRIAISEAEGKITFATEVVDAEAPTPDAEDSASSKDATTEGKEPDENAREEKEPGTGDPDSRDEETESADPETKTKKKRSNDPIRWFGVLVPPALRFAQSSFVSAVSGPVSEIVAIQKELRQQEIEIGRVRKQIKKL